MYRQAFRSRLMRNQNGSEHGFGGDPYRLKIFDHLDATRLPAAAGVNLRLDHPQGPAKRLGSGRGSVRRIGNPACWDWDGVLSEQLFRLILVQIHELYLSADPVA